MVVVIFSLDVAQATRLLTISRILFTKSGYESHVETIYRIDCQSLLGRADHDEQILRLGCHFANPILTLFTSQGAIFLD